VGAEPLIGLHTCPHPPQWLMLVRSDSQPSVFGAMFALQSSFVPLHA
jgi:hypothetical protein